ncbi:DMT family transporter [Acetobacter oeni]|uniref:ABC transporter permease n=1 Tax=Acetobacter oeni TaxID=304077 RepID=A0A511XGJ4_9PROT|nr:DMT family transporter [Acetobacter oeni]MBB3881780.1 drug/metabolite transporter (DMT)-like permease [Acetobacter oeni]NHO17418.1 EamA family transporter [Acetobacter oeni]GBR02026.1 permease [Acetobacter oeni LMG 21952]GEN62048.1 ABC transporter permease [Acetobacter oeni]
MTATGDIRDSSSTGQNWFVLGFLSVLWGGSFFFYKILAPVLPPATLVLGRVGLAALVLHVILRLSGGRLSLTLYKARWFLILGIFNCALPFCLYAWSERSVPSGVAATLNATTPIFTAIAMHLTTKDERLTRSVMTGIGCAFAGVAILIGRDLVGGLSLTELPGELACLGATTSYATGNALSRKLKGISALQLTTGQLTGAAIAVAPFAIFVDRLQVISPLTLSGWAALLGIALLSTALAYLIYFRILARQGATRAALVTFLVPVSAIMMGAVFLGEPVAWNTIAGVALIGIGLAAIDGRLMRRLWRREDPTAA